jgi:uncharacterized protein (DUF488 family)
MAKHNSSIYTIGYQDRSIEDFVNILKGHKLDYVIDIRDTPLSYKPGFSKGYLAKHLPEYGIFYKSIPELGVPKIYRKTLKPKQLWSKYRKLLAERSSQLDEVISICKTNVPVLMCFEADPKQCHRSILANKLKEQEKMMIVHL